LLKELILAGKSKSWTQADPRGPVVEFLNRWRDRLKQVRKSGWIPRVLARAFSFT
jgi:hypothetical protein